MAQKAIYHHIPDTLYPALNPYCLLNMLCMYLFIHSFRNVYKLFLLYQVPSRALWIERTLIPTSFCSCLSLCLELHSYPPPFSSYQTPTQTLKPYSLKSSLTCQREIIPHPYVFPEPISHFYFIIPHILVIKFQLYDSGDIINPLSGC